MVTCIAFAQDATSSTESQSAANPQASGATLKSAYKEHFLVGVAINRSIATGAAGRRGKELVEKDIALVKEQFNQIAPENDLKWQLIHPREGADGYNFEPADAFVEFGQKNNMYMIGHTLVWHSQTPNWVFAGTNPPPGAADAAKKAEGNAPATDAQAPATTRRPRFWRRIGSRLHRPAGVARRVAPADARAHSYGRRPLQGQDQGLGRRQRSHRRRRGGGAAEFALATNHWTGLIAKAFEYAHEADPDAILRYNDYGLENPAKRQKLIKLIKSLQEQKVPIHAIGSQAHVNVSTTFETMDQALTEMATLGLPIHITELDVNSAARGQRGTGADIAANAETTQGGLVSDADKRLADAYAGIFRAFLKHRDRVKMVTFWGANDAVSWRRFGTPLLFDGDNKPKPAFDAVIRVTIESQSNREPVRVGMP